uniref:Uncharacterized protein n=1 Tax=Macaca fascicularis TaxID=9541 RepID=A0A7N9CQR0_MACFA
IPAFLSSAEFFRKGRRKAELALFLESAFLGLSAVAQAYNPSTSGGRGGGGSPEVRWPTWQNPVSTKSTKISWAWWRAPVIPATGEAEAGESLEPGDRGCSERRWRHCTPAWATRAKLCLKTKQNKTKKQAVKLHLKRRKKCFSLGVCVCICLCMLCLPVLLLLACLPLSGEPVLGSVPIGFALCSENQEGPVVTAE